jgi:hypothetical protein
MTNSQRISQREVRVILRAIKNDRQEGKASHFWGAVPVGGEGK